MGTEPVLVFLASYILSSFWGDMRTLFCVPIRSFIRNLGVPLAMAFIFSTRLNRCNPKSCEQLLLVQQSRLF